MEVHVYDDHWKHLPWQKTHKFLGKFPSIEIAKQDPEIQAFIESGRVIGFYTLIHVENDEPEEPK